MDSGHIVWQGCYGKCDDGSDDSVDNDDADLCEWFSSIHPMTTRIFVNERSLVSVGQSAGGAGEEASFWSENWH